MLYVVRSDYAKRSQITDGIQSLDSQHIKISGCVTNGVAPGRSSHGYGYGKYGYGKYGYGKYGYGKYGKSKKEKAAEAKQ